MGHTYTFVIFTMNHFLVRNTIISLSKLYYVLEHNDTAVIMHSENYWKPKSISANDIIECSEWPVVLLPIRCLDNICRVLMLICDQIWQNTHPVSQVWRFMALSGSMPLVSNFFLLFHEHMTKLCENSRSIAWCNIKLQLIKVEELDVCGSLVLSIQSHIVQISYTSSV